MNGSIAFINVPASQLKYKASVTALRSRRLEVLCVMVVMEGGFLLVEAVDHKNHMTASRPT